MLNIILPSYFPFPFSHRSLPYGKFSVKDFSETIRESILKFGLIVYYDYLF